MQFLAKRHERIRPYVPQDDGKFEGYSWLMTDEGLCAEVYYSEQGGRPAVQVRVDHQYCYRRMRLSCSGLTHTEACQQRHALLHLGAAAAASTSGAVIATCSSMNFRDGVGWRR